MTVLSSISRTLESFYYQQLGGGLDAELFHGWFLQYLDLLANKGPAEFWAMRKHQFTSEFASFLDEKIAQHSAHPLYTHGDT